MITSDEFSTALILFKWINPNINEWPLVWKKEEPIQKNRFYQLQKNKKTVALWMDVTSLSEIQFKRIYKKHTLLTHVFFLTHKNGIYRFGWRIE